MGLEIKVPPVGESITEVVLSRWVKNDGDFVEMDEIIAELESDKATFELTAEKAGTLKIVASEGDTLPIGAVVCSIEEGGAAASPKAESPKADAAAPVADKVSAPVAEKSGDSYATGTPSPSAAKILAEKGVDAGSVKGTGVDGRITKDDAAKAEKAPSAKAESPKATTQPAAVAGARGERREKMSPLRKTVAKRLVTVKNETAMLTTFNEVNMKPIMEMRAQFKDAFEKRHGARLGFMSFFVKAATEALKRYPAVNASIDGDDIVYHGYYDIGVAVSSERGLVVPILRDTDRMNYAEVENGIRAYAGKARDGKLGIEDMTGGTFTITNGGTFGSLLSTPILNTPQTAILGMHKIQERPMAVNGQVEILPMMYLALSYDHRLIDGKEAVGFLVAIKELLEEPARLILDL